MAKAMHAESTTNNQIRAASQRATQTSHAKEVFVSRAHLQLFCQKVTDNMEDAESKAFISKLYMEAAAESMQMGMGLELSCPAPVVGVDYDDACSESDDEAPPPPVSSKSSSKSKSSKPVKGKGSGTSRPDMKGKKSGWNLFRQDVATKAPSAEFVARDADLTPEQRSAKTDKDKPAHPLWTKENGTKFTDAGMGESWKILTNEQKAAWNEQAADEWAILVAARAQAAASAPSDSDDQVIVEDPDDAELPMPLSAPAEESDDNDAPPPPPPPPPTPKSKRPVEEPPAVKRKSKRSGAGRKSVRIATPAEEEPAEEEPAEEEPAEEEPAEEPVEEEPVEEATTAEDLFGEE